MAAKATVENLDASVWTNIASFLHPYEQCRLLRLNTYMNKLKTDESIQLPLHNFDADLLYFQQNFHEQAEYRVNNMVKDELTTLIPSNGTFANVTNEQRLQLLYFLKYHTNLAALYQAKVDEILEQDDGDNDDDSDNDGDFNYALDFYKQIKFLYALDLSDNNDAFTIEYVMKYIQSVDARSESVYHRKKSALLKEVYLNGNKLDDECLLRFINMVQNELPQWKNLRRLNLSDNPGITDKHIGLLLEVIIAKCDGMEELSLESTSISDNTIDTLYAMFEKYPTKTWVKQLNLRFNENISEQAAEKISNDAFKEKYPEIAQGMVIKL